MAKFADPKTDIAFKKLFADNKHKDVLISFLNTILDRKPNRQIIDAVILDPNNQPEVDGFKFTILDVRCTDQSGHQYIVEMQKKEQSYFAQRAVHYASQVFSRQLKPRGKYEELMPVIFVGVLNFSAFASKKPVTHHLILNTENYEQELRHQEFHFVELSKFLKQEHELVTIEDKWLYLLKNAPEIDNVPKILASPDVLLEALEILRTHQWSMQDQEVYDKELDNARVEKDVLETAIKKGIAKGEQQGLAEGLQQGLQQGLKQGLKQGERQKALSVAKHLLEKGVDTELVCGATGLSEKDVLGIKKDL